MVNYCEKENLIIDKFRLESTNGITEKYDWEFIVEEYIKILKKLTLSEKSMSI